MQQARREAGLSQVDAARLLGRPQQWVSKCELGERRVDFVELDDFARAYRHPLEFYRPSRRA